MGIEFRHLRYFIAVAEEVNFRCAAERIHNNQTPLSLTVRDLDDQLGVPLFMCMPLKLCLIPAGVRPAQGSSQAFHSPGAHSARRACDQSPLPRYVFFDAGHTHSGHPSCNGGRFRLAEGTTVREPLQAEDYGDLADMLIKNARIVTRNEEFTGVVRVTDGRIDEVAIGATSAKNAEDWGGDYLMPGLVDLHTDNIEKHIKPGPGDLWNFDAAMVVHDALMASAGITTVFDSLRTGSHRGIDVRGNELQTNWARSIDRLAERGLLRVDHFLHLRCELVAADLLEVFDGLVSHPLLRLVSVMDRRPGRRQWDDPAQWRKSQDLHGRVSDEHATTTLNNLISDRQRHRSEIVARCKLRGLPLASHDDTSIEHILEAAKDGIVLAEFPTTLAAAGTARELGIATIMGAPNVVCNGSHSGNVSAVEMAKLGLLDILSSNYLPSSLLAATFDLADKAGWTLPRAMCTVSSTPANAVGLTDRGAVSIGLRADFVRVTIADRLPVARATFVRGKRVA